MNEERREVYPFCGPCTTSSVVWRAADVAGPMGSRFYGHHDICENCGSSVRTLYSTLLWIPVSKVGRFRVIPTGGRSYIGRQVVARQIETVVRREPASALVSHPNSTAIRRTNRLKPTGTTASPGRTGPSRWW